jgi:hypothetical protein
MVRKAAAGLAALGLIGGAGAVTYDDNGAATVTIADHGVNRTVNLPMEKGGKRFKCPDGIETKLSPYDILGGRIQLTIEDVRRDEKAIVTRYDADTAPRAVMHKYKLLVARDHRLTARFNRTVDKHNAVIDANCET